MCVAKYSEDKQWYRAVVTALTGNQRVRVLYVDYGNTEELPYFELRKISDEFIRLPIRVSILLKISDKLIQSKHACVVYCKLFGRADK